MMKKTHRRAVCLAILFLPSVLGMIFAITADSFGWMVNGIADFADWLKTKMRVWDEDE